MKRASVLADVPEANLWSPSPTVLASGDHLAVAFFTKEATAGRLPAPSRSDEVPVALLHFHSPHAFRCTPALERHLAEQPPCHGALGAFERHESPWLASQRDSSKRPTQPRLRHFTLCFPELVIECLAAGYSCEQRTTFDDVPG